MCTLHMYRVEFRDEIDVGVVGLVCVQFQHLDGNRTVVHTFTHKTHSCNAHTTPNTHYTFTHRTNEHREHTASPPKTNAVCTQHGMWYKVQVLLVVVLVHTHKQHSLCAMRASKESEEKHTHTQTHTDTHDICSSMLGSSGWNNIYISGHKCQSNCATTLWVRCHTRDDWDYNLQEYCAYYPLSLHQCPRRTQRPPRRAWRMYAGLKDNSRRISAEILVS